ncbi:MAG TPA: YciI family protein [Sphingobacteriaceae bacterium]
MKQYTIFALDYTDAGAPGRRMEAREAHLEGVRQLKAQGRFLFAGAILDDGNRMIGSNLILQFESETELLQWKEREPYIAGKVWEKIEIRPLRVATV